ncbi:torsin-1A-like [Haliotis cracherodii]|uniref:torsin-1A-like n=1 Tax=Haliotis cracherodii TaxID=6455 RepID=UPI0039ECFD49
MQLLTATCVVVACCVHSAVCADPFADFVEVMTLTAEYAGRYYDSVRSYFAETCDDRWIHDDLIGLSDHLNKKLYGQHLAQEGVMYFIARHLQSAEPDKALVLSFHGRTGTGKHYVSNIIAQHLYRKGLRSQFVHLISAAREFPHEERVPYYKDRLRAWIEFNIARCPRSIFIFAEMNKMPPGLIDTIAPYLDSYYTVGGVNYRKAIYIFLSTTAGDEITQYAFQHWWNGYPRKDISPTDVINIIFRTATSTKNELWNSEMVYRPMITAYIPFLPLEKSHVRRCIEDRMVARGYLVTDDTVESVMKEILFWPEREQVFSVIGCKISF